MATDYQQRLAAAEERRRKAWRRWKLTSRWVLALSAWALCGLIATSGVEATECHKIRMDMVIYQNSYGVFPRLPASAAVDAESGLGIFAVAGPLGLFFGAAGTNIFAHGLDRGCLAKIQKDAVAKLQQTHAETKASN